MSTTTRGLLCVLLITSLSYAQELTKEPARGFDFLMHFEGKWTAESTAPAEGGKPQVTKGTVESRAIGGNWMVLEHTVNMGDMKFEALQTVGYDSKTKRYIGTWVDSMMKFTWKYDGTLDKEGKRLVLNADGPDWNKPGAMRKYRDIYELKSKDEFVTTSQMKNDAGEWETFMSGKMTRVKATAEKTPKVQSKVAPFLMFTGEGKSAIKFYETVFSVETSSMTMWAAGETGKVGTIKVADIVVEGQHVRISDSPIKHDFDFTPSFSFFVECKDEAELKTRFEKLSDGGKVMMPLNNYGFSEKFGWVSDKFGVSWQLNLN